MLRLSAGKLICTAITALLLGAGIYKILAIKGLVRDILAVEKTRLSLSDRVPFETKRLLPHDKDSVDIIQNAADVRDLARFRDAFYAATSGGLIQVSATGEILRHFTVLDGLPESDLTCLAAFDGKLYIGTRTSGLAVFDGEEFSGVTFTDRKTESVTSFAEDGGTLLIGTFAGGLLRFDGNNFTEIRAGDQRLAAVNCIRLSGPKLYVGTFNNGLFIYENDIWSHFTTAEGLPSNRIVGVETAGKDLYAATDFGLAVLDGGAFRNMATVPALSGTAFYNGRLFLAEDDGRLYTFDRNIKELLPAAGLRHARLVPLEDKLWLLSSAGISVYEDSRLRAVTKPEGPLTDNFVSALTLAGDGALWAGTFRRGIDVLSANGENLRHIESESIREINYLTAGPDGISAATSAGLFRFSGASPREPLTVKEGLPSNSVTHVSDDVIATAKGLAFGGGGRLRVLTNIQGLPNNSVYTTIKAGEKLYAGTLGGIAEIVEGRVVRTFKDSNSNLTTNWVTAFCVADGRLFIGTYGGGVFELTPAGEIRSFQPEAGKFVVNPNAMYSDGERLYAGTLNGVKALDLRTQAWQTYKNILPAQTVMSLTGDAAAIYIGTTNGIARVKRSFFTQKEEK